MKNKFGDKIRNILGVASPSVEILKNFYPNFYSMDTRRQKIVKRISSEYPYSVEVVSGIYANNKFSEEDTRKELEKMMMLGR